MNSSITHALSLTDSPIVRPTVSLARLRNDTHYNPVVPRKLHRKPTPSEIAFGHGCTIWSEANVPFRKQFVTIDGTRWAVAR